MAKRKTKRTTKKKATRAPARRKAARKKAPARKKATKKKATKKKATKRKATRKKATRKKAPARKKVTKKAAAARPGKIVPAPKPRTRSDIYNQIAAQTGLARKEVQSVFDAFGMVLAADLGKRGPGIMQVPGLMKVVVKRMPAKKARKGINPFTKEETMFKAKPARNVVKVRPLQALKKMV
jgi:nucleoid DNA-binding protein